MFRSWDSTIVLSEFNISKSTADTLLARYENEELNPDFDLESFNDETALMHYRSDSFFTADNLTTLKNSFLTFLTNFTALEIGLFLIFVILTVLGWERLKIKKVFNFVFELNKVIVESLLCTLCYLIPYVECLEINHVEFVYRQYPYFRLLLSDFVLDTLHIYQSLPIFGFLYFMLGYALVVRYKFVKPRIVRFHFCNGLFIMFFQQIAGQGTYPIFQQYVIDQNFDDACNLTCICLIISLAIIFPCMLNGALRKYPSNPFIREAIELHLGRDGPDFIWWDRRKN
jgi:hypothetical protein